MLGNLQRKIATARRLAAEEGPLRVVAHVGRLLLGRFYDVTVGRWATRIAERATLGDFSNFLLSLSPVRTTQIWSERREVMRDLMRRSCTGPVRALEIGTWFGKGSTRVWLEALPDGSQLILVDGWRPFLSATDSAEASTAYRYMDLVPHSAIVSTLREIYRSESVRPTIEVMLLRGSSRNALPLLQPHACDFIYIDGSHYYQDVLSDIREAKRLARSDFSIVCGDDLELAPDDILLEIARRHRDNDTAHTDAGAGFHPGVMLAVHEEFGVVNMRDGFWWIYMRNGSWSLT